LLLVGGIEMLHYPKDNISVVTNLVGSRPDFKEIANFIFMEKK
jgi:hypothetical protein